MPRRLLTVLLATATLAGCSLSIGPDGQACTSAEDCDPGQTCQQGACSDGCQDPCAQAGVRECRGDVVYECRQSGDCLRFEAVEDCSDDGQTCQQGACSDGCQDPCAQAGVRECRGDVVYECRQSGDCLRFEAVEDCSDDGQTCQQGACSDGCQDPCDHAGVSECRGEVIYECRQSGDCLHFEMLQDCSSDGQSCRQFPGYAQCGEPPCSNACSQAEQGDTSCYDEQFRTECQYTDNDCWEWVGIEDCYPDAICREEAGVSSCVIPCQDQCTPEDASRCDGSLIQHCTEGDSGCLEWSDGTDCAQDSAVCVDDVQPAACCQPNCGGRMCGPDPGACGTLCGDGCAQGETCAGGNCLTFGWVMQPGDVFTMGADEGPTSEQPAHEVTIPSFEILRTEVTADQYKACVDDGACSAPTNDHELCNYDTRPHHPINCVTWEMADTYCQWLGARLPSEAEWEFAARDGGADHTYPWGSSPEPDCDHAVMWLGSAGCGTGGSMAVGSMPMGATPDSGLLDMAGNVDEWVQDWYHGNYNGAPADGSAWEDDGSLRVVRGGGYNSQAQALRTRSRSGYLPSTKSPPVGFRCARDSQ